MKTLIYLIPIVLLAIPAHGQSTWRNFFTTNRNPIVTVTAGSNVTVQASTVGANQRVFTVNSDPGTSIDIVQGTNTGVVWTTNAQSQLIANVSSELAPLVTNNASGLTNLNATELRSGTVDPARLATNAAAAGKVLAATSAGSAAWSDAVGGDPNAVTNNETRAIQFTNTANPASSNMTVILGDKIASTNAQRYVSITNGTIATSGTITAGGVLSSSSSISAGSDVQAGSQSSFKWASASDVQIASTASKGTVIITDLTYTKDRFFLNGPVKILTDNTAVNIAQIDVFTNSTFKSAFVGGRADYTIFCIDAEGGQAQEESGTVLFSSVNTNGVFYNSTVTQTSTNQSKTSGTLTTVWDLTPKAANESTNIYLRVTADTSLTPAANKFYILWQAVSNGTNNITAQ